LFIAKDRRSGKVNWKTLIIPRQGVVLNSKSFCQAGL
jgi:hypothetical protein